MRLIRFILTTIVFLVTFVIVLAAEYATLTLVTAPGSIPGQEDNSVERVHLFPSDDPSQITYSDAIAFWSFDVSHSLDTATANPEFAIRGWFDWHIWYENMTWADYGYSYVKALTVPFFAPVYEIKEVYIYYGAELEDFIVTDTPITGAQDRRNNAIEFALEYGMEALKEYDMDDYQFVYNLNRKIEKYNAVDNEGIPVYRDFVVKFINYEGDIDGVYEFQSIDAVSAILFYQLFLAFVLAVYFTYQNPIVVKRNYDNEHEVEGRVLPKVPRFGFGKRAKKGKKRD